jgi:hypothetical protein
MRSAAASVVEVAAVPPSIMFSSVVVTVAPSRIPISVEVNAASADAPPDWHEERVVRSAARVCAPMLVRAVAPVSKTKLEPSPTIKPPSVTARPATSVS